MTAVTSARAGDEAGTGGLRRGISRNMLLFFVVGDVLGAGIYALVGAVGGEVGGAIWTAFAIALALAVFTAFAYAELVTKYPQAAGAALYVDKAFRIPFALVPGRLRGHGLGDHLGEHAVARLRRRLPARVRRVPTVLAALVFICGRGRGQLPRHHGVGEGQRHPHRSSSSAGSC